MHMIHRAVHAPRTFVSLPAACKPWGRPQLHPPKQKASQKTPEKISKRTTSNPGGMRSELIFKIYIENPDLQEARISGVLVLIPIFSNAFGQVTLELV
jgi:hypothetical protein